MTGLAFVGSNGNPSHIFDMTLIPKTSTTLIVPHVAQNNIWDSTVFICNPNSTSVNVVVKVFDKPGTTLFTKSYSIPARGSKKIDVWTLIQWGSLTGGSVEITANKAWRHLDSTTTLTLEERAAPVSAQSTRRISSRSSR